MVNQNGAIYWYQCGDLGCDDEYIGETSRTFGERYIEQLKAPSPIHHHSNQTGQPTSHNNFQIIGREGHNVARYIKESILLGLIIPLQIITLANLIYLTYGIGSYSTLKVLI